MKTDLEESPTVTVNCRAQVHAKCQSGLPITKSEYAEPREAGQKDVNALEHYREDGTYDEITDSVVCTPCYIEIGLPLRPHIETAIERYRRDH